MLLVFHVHRKDVGAFVAAFLEGDQANVLEK